MWWLIGRYILAGQMILDVASPCFILMCNITTRSTAIAEGLRHAISVEIFSTAVQLLNFTERYVDIFFIRLSDFVRNWYEGFKVDNWQCDCCWQEWLVMICLIQMLQLCETWSRLVESTAQRLLFSLSPTQ